jgi:hypothetical protein
MFTKNTQQNKRCMSQLLCCKELLSRLARLCFHKTDHKSERTPVSPFVFLFLSCCPKLEPLESFSTKYFSTKTAHKPHYGSRNIFQTGKSGLFGIAGPILPLEEDSFSVSVNKFGTTLCPRLCEHVLFAN